MNEHGIITALVELIDAALPNIDVLDGDTLAVDADLPKRLVCVGASSPNAPAVTVAAAPEEGGLGDLMYDMEVNCSTYALDGEMEYGTKRVKVQAVLDAIHEALVADLKLGGLAYETWLARERQWFQLSDETGTTVWCDFTIIARVFAP
ncbi:hypothetical protein [Streptomyces sp.]|uniref:hypothetical protein n=1 Tax=Streptomyces sp. TaxID=1931 RepID=UPI002F9201B7